MTVAKVDQAEKAVFVPFWISIFPPLFNTCSRKYLEPSIKQMSTRPGRGAKGCEWSANFRCSLNEPVWCWCIPLRKFSELSRPYEKALARDVSFTVTLWLICGKALMAW